jgi:amino acid transporter
MAIELTLPFTVIVFIIGIAYGFLRPGKENKWGLLKWGVIIGIILAIVFWLISFFISGIGGFGFWAFIIYLIVFIIGVFIGDALEGLKKK